MMQSELDRAHARHDDPGTSKEAAEAITPRITEIERQVLVTLLSEGPLTAFQISKRSEVEYGSTSPRLKNMENKSLVRRLAPEAREGRKKSIVWEAIHGG